MRWLLLSALLVLTGCVSKITAQNGRFTLGYTASVQVENFVKPIAPGAKLDVHAFANGSSDKLAIVSASSTRPEILRVVAAADETVVLQGVAPGGAEITVRARDASGEELTDTMFFHVANAATHRLEHTCTEEAGATYVRGAPIDVFHGLATSDRRPVVGYEHLPVSIEPRGALDLAAQPQAGGLYRFTAPKAQARVVMRSLVDQGELTFQIVDAGDLTDADLYAPDEMLAGEVQYALARVEHGQAPLCSQNALTRARSLTPEVCRVTARLEDSTADENREQLAEIQALGFGHCEIEMTLPELAHGRGAVLRKKIRVGRVEYPRSRWEGILSWFILPRVVVLAWWASRWASRRRRRAP